MQLINYKNKSGVLLILFAIVTSTIAQNEVKIGNQIWMNENLNVEKFQNGDDLIQAQSNEAWENAGFAHQPAWCYYEMDTKNGKKYGKLYNRFALYDARLIAPKGWHIPSISEWQTLITYLGGDTIAGAKLKSAELINNNIKKSELSGFNALLGGWRDVGFGDIGAVGCWWTINSLNLEKETHYYQITGDDAITTNYTTWIMGYSIRCIKD